MKKFLIVLSIIASIFIVFCLSVILLVQFPGFQETVTGFLTNETLATTTVEQTTIKETTIPVTEETTVEEPKLTTTTMKWTYKGVVDIEYPVISGMADTTLQDKINDKILNNAKSIVDLYPISTSMQNLNITSKVNDLTEDVITILYEGRVVGYTVKNGDTAISNNNYQGPSGSSALSDNPTNNYQLPGINQGINNTFPNNYQNDMTYPIIDGNSLNSNETPNNSSNVVPQIPVVGFSRTVNVDQKIFLTNSINLKNGLDFHLSELVNPETLAKYARSSKAEIVNLDDNDESEVRKYIRKSTVPALTEVFEKADFKNTKLTSWPKSFSYVENGDLYFTVKLSSKLGNFALIKYSLNKN